MNNNQQHIPTEKDAELAKRFGQYLEGNIDKSSIIDPLLPKLEIAKQAESTRQTNVTIRGQESVWNSLSSQIDFSQSNYRRTISLRTNIYSSWYRFAAAAIVILSLSVVLWMQFGNTGSELIANRSSKVQTIELTDGSTVTLRPNSELAYIENSAKFISLELSGEAVFDVTSNPDRVFSVVTNNSRVTVTGTKFNVRSTQNKSSVHLLEGSVTFETLDASKSVELNPGQASEIKENGDLSDPFEFDEQVVLGWTQLRLSLENRPLILVIEELELHFGVKIQVPDTLSNELLGGSISLESLDQTLNDLGLVLDGNFEVSQSGEYQFKPDS